MATKDTLWTVFIGSAVVFISMWIFFSFLYSSIIAEEKVNTNKFLVPIDTLLWMFSLDNPIFIFVVLVVAAGVISIGILNFHPAFKAPVVAAANNAVNQMGGFLRRLGRKHV